MEYKMYTMKSYRVSVTGTLVSDYYTINNNTGLARDGLKLKDAQYKTTFDGPPLCGASIDSIRKDGTFSINLDKNKKCDYIFTNKKGEITPMDDKIKAQHLMPGQTVTVVLEIDARPQSNYTMVLSANPMCVGFHDEPHTYERERDRQLALHYLSRLKDSCFVINKNGAEKLAMQVLNLDNTLTTAQRITYLSTFRDKIAYSPEASVEKLLHSMNIPNKFSDYELAYIDKEKMMDMYEITEHDLDVYRQNNPDGIKPYEYIASDAHDPKNGVGMDLEYSVSDDSMENVEYVDGFDLSD